MLIARARSALVSASSFKVILLCPAIQVMIMMDGLVACRFRYATDKCVGRVGPESHFGSVLAVSEVESHGFSDDDRESGFLGPRPVLEFPVGLLGESQIGSSISRHGDITISRLCVTIN